MIDIDHGPTGGKAWGMIYKDKEHTEIIDRRYQRIKYALQRSHWEYIPDRKPCTLDNGVEYDHGKILSLISEKEKMRQKINFFKESSQE